MGDDMGGRLVAREALGWDGMHGKEALGTWDGMNDEWGHE